MKYIVVTGLVLLFLTTVLLINACIKYDLENKEKEKINKEE